MSHREDPDFDDYLDELVPGGFEIPEIYDSVPASYVLKSLEPIGYSEEQKKWRDERDRTLKKEARSLLESSPNDTRFARASKYARNHSLIPFVGAGLSMPAGYPSWQGFILDLADQAGLNAEIQDAMARSDFEGAAGCLASGYGHQWFAERVRETFCDRDHPVRGPVRLIPEIFGQGPVLTTNFDDHLERAFAGFLGAGFRDRPSGRSRELTPSMVKNREYCLVKIHGRVDYPALRILLPEEYEAAYGSAATPDLNRTLPKFLDDISRNCHLLFLGCSLVHDRTLQVFRQAAKTRSEENDPITHYAVLEEPSSATQRNEREKYLSSCGVFPIWYPRDEHHLVEGLLLLLRDALS